MTDSKIRHRVVAVGAKWVQAALEWAAGPCNPASPEWAEPEGPSGPVSGAPGGIPSRGWARALGLSFPEVSLGT